MTETVKALKKLDKDGNITDSERERFVSDTLAILSNGSQGSSFPFPCLAPLQRDPDSALAAGLASKEQFPAFHAFAVGTYTGMLRSVNIDVSRPLMLEAGLFDPTVLAASFDGAIPSPLPSLGEIIGSLVNPIALIGMMGISPLTFAARLPSVLAGLKPTIPPIPELPSISLLEIGAVDLFEFELAAFKSPLDSLGGLLAILPELIGQGFPPNVMVERVCAELGSALATNDQRQTVRNAMTMAATRRIVPIVVSNVPAMALGAGGAVHVGTYIAAGGDDDVQPTVDNGSAVHDPLPLVAGIDKTSFQFRKALVSTANSIGVDPGQLAAVIAFETAGTFDPKIRPSTNKLAAIGLLQWIPGILPLVNDVIGGPIALAGKQIDFGSLSPIERVDFLASLSDIQQLDMVQHWYNAIIKSKNGKIPSTVVDMYLAVLAGGNGIGASDSFTVFKTGDGNYESNKALDANNDGKITKGEVRGKIESVYNAGKTRGEISS